MDMNFYNQKLIKCEYNYGHCKYQDFESEMKDTSFGKVCWPCYHIICIGDKKKEVALKDIVNY